MFVEVEVGATPFALSVLLGRTTAQWTADQVWLFRGRVQNRGPATVYRAVSPTIPDPGGVRGFRHPVGSEVHVETWGSDLTMAYFWTSGTATLIFEETLP